MSPAVFDYIRIQYDSLPEGIKASYTYDEYRAMGDYGRAKLIEYETEPDYAE